MVFISCNTWTIYPITTLEAVLISRWHASEWLTVSASVERMTNNEGCSDIRKFPVEFLISFKFIYDFFHQVEWTCKLYTISQKKKYVWKIKNVMGWFPSQPVTPQLWSMQSFVWDGYFGIDKSFHFSRILFVIKFLTLLPICQDKRSNVYVGCFFGMEKK